MTLELLSYILVFLYAAALITVLLGINPFRLPLQKKCIYFVGMVLIIAVSTLIMLLGGLGFFGKYYLLFGQIPGIVGFYLVSRRSWGKIIFVLFTAVFLVLPCTLSGLVCNELLGLSIPWILLGMTLVALLVIFLVWRFIRPNFVFVLDYFGTKDILKFCVVPLSYTLLIYYIDGYTVSFSTMPMRVFLFVSTLAVYVILMDIFRRTRELQLVQGEKDLVSLQLEASRRYLEELKHTQQQTMAYRHDMRHHLALISACLAAGKLDKMEEYLVATQQDMNMISPKRFCENETVNLILSSYAEKANRLGIEFSANVEISESLPFSDTELCALLSNGLENAVTAAARAKGVSKGRVTLYCKTKESRLLLSMENNYSGTLVLENGIPQAEHEGHGYGMKSMMAITERWSGYCACETNGEIFTLRIVLPLGSGER